MSKILSTINSSSDLKNLGSEQLLEVAEELRAFIIDIVASKEGHLGASLGVVELTIALHYVFDTPEDLLVWDVGHQAYGHKILTGRRDCFHTNRQKGGLSGFPKRSESEYDAFGVGHSSTAISAALGMAIASQLQGKYDKRHIAVVGDASIASGMAFEGLNHAGVTDANLLVVLNDNAIGIDPSVGALKNYLTAVKSGHNPRGNNMIKSLNFAYSGPIDGHDLPKLIRELQRLKKAKGPQFLHVITTKGKGLKQAEENQVRYHAPGKFNKATGDLLPTDDTHLPPKYQDVFGLTLVELAKQNEAIVGITPAMPTGSSMKYMMEAFPERGFDVGIAEQHAVTLAAGMATQGLLPFCAIYSTFLQRAYDQVIHDVALQNLNVVFCMDRAGLVGEDGATHQGVFDIAYMNCVPNLTLLAPLNEIELRNALYTIQKRPIGAVAIRYPRGRGTTTKWRVRFEELDFSEVRRINEGNKAAFLTTGTIGNNVLSAFREIGETEWGHYHFLKIKPLNAEVLQELGRRYTTLITLEEGTVIGGFGMTVASYMAEHFPKVRVVVKGVSDHFVEHASVEQQQIENKIDTKSIIEILKNGIE